MGKNYDRGMGRSSTMQDRLIDRVERTKFFYQDEVETQTWQPPARSWTPERWENRRKVIATAVTKGK